MTRMKIFLLILIVFIKNSNEDDIRSVEMSVMDDSLFQCGNTTCSPFITFTVSDILACQIACLADIQCQAASFYKSTANCELFANMSNRTGNMLSQTNTISMIIMSGTRMSSATTTSSKNPCLTGAYWNVTGSTVAGTGATGSGLNKLTRPYGIYLDSSHNLYITDAGNFRVMKYLYGAHNGTVIAGTTGMSGSSLNQFSTGMGFLYVDSSQNLYVADYGNKRVTRWLSGASSGFIVAGDGTSGSSLNQIRTAIGIWVDSNSTIFVAESGNHRVTKWNLNASLGVLVAGISRSPGNTSDKLSGPIGLVYDEVNQDLYIANANAHTVMKWHIGDPNGTVIAGIPGISGLNTSLLKSPNGITLDQWKNLYVADTSNNRIQLFCHGSRTGITIAGNGTSGSSLSTPADVKLDSQMNLYVCEFNRHCITKFNKI